MKTIIKSDDGRDIQVLTMGPICIAPDLKRRGYGKSGFDYFEEFDKNFHGKEKLKLPGQIFA